MVAVVWTGVGFSHFKNFRIRTSIKKFWVRSGVWKVTPATSGLYL